MLYIYLISHKVKNDVLEGQGEGFLNSDTAGWTWSLYCIDKPQSLFSVRVILTGKLQKMIMYQHKWNSIKSKNIKNWKKTKRFKTSEEFKLVKFPIIVLYIFIPDIQSASVTVEHVWTVFQWAPPILSCTRPERRRSHTKLPRATLRWSSPTPLTPLLETSRLAGTQPHGSQHLEHNHTVHNIWKTTTRFTGSGTQPHGSQHLEHNHTVHNI